MSGFATARQKMVDGQVRPNDVTDIRILDAMLAVPREAFVPANQRALAYLDLDLDVSEGGAAKRFLIKPQVTGKDAAGRRDQGNRQGSGGGLRDRICGGRGRQARGAGDCDRKRSGAGGEGQAACWPSSGLPT